MSAIIFKIVLKNMWSLINHTPSLANKISTVRGEAVLFLPARYFFQRAISSGVLFLPASYYENNRTLPL